MYLINFIIKKFRIRDHFQITGDCKVSSHQIFNGNYRLIKRILLIFHEIRGNDCHLIMQ